MKWLLYILAAVAGLAGLALIVLLAVGGGRGVSRQVANIEIARPADVVFGWISEPERLESWVGWLVEIQTLTPPPAAVGSRYLWVMEDRNNNSARIEVITEITRLETNRVLETRISVSESYAGTVIYELERVDATRTHLAYRATYRFEHWLAKLLEPIISRSAKHKLDADLDRLKQLAEAEQARGVAIGAVYATLDRLEENAWATTPVTTWPQECTCVPRPQRRPPSSCA